jgi:PII-like signaling protein
LYRARVEEAEIVSSQVEPAPSLAGQVALMRIYTDEKARAGHKALFEAIVLKARDEGLAGATVLRGPMGFGHSHHIHTASILNLSESLPVVIELVDDEEKLKHFCNTLESFEDIGLVTLEKVQVLHYGPFD